MNIKSVTLILAMLLSVLMAWAQSYSARPGETVLRIDVEGKGSIFIRMNTDKAPKASAQIAKLARQGFYDGQRWFRVVKKPRPFLIQTGDPQSKDASKLDGEKMGEVNG